MAPASDAKLCHEEMKRKHGPRFLGLFLIWMLKRKPLYGYSIIEQIRGLGLIPVRASTIYMVLSKLEKAGFVKSSRKEVKKRVRRVYFATPKGKQAFEKVKKNKIKGAVREFLKALLE